MYIHVGQKVVYCLTIECTELLIELLKERFSKKKVLHAWLCSVMNRYKFHTQEVRNDEEMSLAKSHVGQE